MDINGTNFINTRLMLHVFSVLNRGPTRRNWEMEMHSVAILATLQTPLATPPPPPPKKAPKPCLVSEKRRYCRGSVRSCFPSTRTHLSLSLCVWPSVQFLFSTHTHIFLSLCVWPSVQFLFRAHTNISLSLSLSLCICSVSVQRAAEKSRT